jgi:hypothetical protein
LDGSQETAGHNNHFVEPNDLQFIFGPIELSEASGRNGPAATHFISLFESIAGGQQHVEPISHLCPSAATAITTPAYAEHTAQFVAA